MNWRVVIAASIAFAIVLTVPTAFTGWLRFAYWQPVPDIFLIIAIVWGIWRGSISGSVMGFALGLLEGYMQGMHHGQFAISRMLAGLIAGWLRESIFHEHWLVPSLCAALATLSSEIALLITVPHLLIHTNWYSDHAITIAIEVAYAVVLVPLLLNGLRWMMRERATDMSGATSS